MLLEVVGEQLPQREQEGLETVIGLIAVAAVTYMIVWMRRNARGIKTALEGEAAHALARGSAMALVAMAFLAVLREGFETSVFMLAAFQDATDTTAAGAGAVIGLILGDRDRRRPLPRRRADQPQPLLPHHRPDPRLRRRRPARRARCTPPTRPAGSTRMQAQALDLTWLVQPGTVSGSLLTGMLGLQPTPTIGEVARLPALRGADDALRPLAGPPAPPRRGAGADQTQAAAAAESPA